MNFSKELNSAIKIAKKAGQILIDYYGRVRVDYKPDMSIVTRADLESERVIKTQLSKLFPDHSLLGEETGYDDKLSDYVWIIDPLDGTTNYIIKNPFFSVSISLTYRNKPVLGIVYYPFQGELFYSEKDNGAYLNDKRIFVSKEESIDNGVLTYCSGRDYDSLKQIANFFGKFKLKNKKFRQIGAASLELCYVACGRTGGFIMPGVYPWDIAAGLIMVEEAGGETSDFEGKSFYLNSNNLIASNGILHGEMLKIINS
jgi:myo-inositol-1(or 4)-monophosphatase